jgi:hypothetical protein
VGFEAHIEDYPTDGGDVNFWVERGARKIQKFCWR